ncbi:MAG: hypothetical protein ACP5H7_01165 [Minisyncoccia bacterium]
MNIIWKEKNYIEIETKNQKGEDIKILLFPPKENFEKEIQKNNPQIVIFTDDLSYKEKDIPYFLISEPGEYETKDVFVYLFFIEPKVYFIKIVSENIKISHLNSFSKKDLPEEIIEKLGQIDILFFSLESLNPKEASALVSQLEPKIAIPIGYEKNKEDILKDFLKQRGIKKEIEKIDKLKIKDTSLPRGEDYETQLVILNPSKIKS